MVADRFTVPDEIAVRVQPADMHASVVAIFEALDMSPDDARRCADVLLYADIRGIDSHGVSNMMPYYVNGLRDGSINAAPKWSITKEAPATATIDSDRGLGLTIGPQAMALAIEKAKVCGIGAVSATNGGHYGAAAYHAHMALDHDMIGVSCTVGGIQVVPTFGSRGVLGLNPIAIAAPAATEAPFVFDASMSSVAANKIRILKRLGGTVPPGWIAEMDGSPVLDERAVPDQFLMLPTGGTRDNGSHKGYGMAMFVDIVAGVLSGTGPGFASRQGKAHHFLAYRIDAFTELDLFKSDMDHYLRELREMAPAPGEERVLYPGLKEHEAEVDRRERGIPYHPDVVRYFQDTARDLSVATAL
jgi:LDH2 family malate/lactate/ureidoglycolate dehydrogenase